MGCGKSKEILPLVNSTKNKFSKTFEEYSELDFQTYNAYFYQLLWKTRPKICFFQLKEQDKFNKKEINNFNILFKQKIITRNNNIDILSKDRLLIYYLHCNNGVIITRNSNKINYLISGDKFNIYELKNQSKYFFNLNNKEIDFTHRNELVSMGKQEKIFLEEIITEDEEVEEKKIF